MRLLAAALIYVAVSTVAAVILGENAGGLSWGVSFVSLIAGASAAVATFFLMVVSSLFNARSDRIIRPSSLSRSGETPCASGRAIYHSLITDHLSRKRSGGGMADTYV